MHSLFGLRSIAQALGLDSREVLERMGGVTGQKLISAMSPRHNDWYRIVNITDEKRAELYIYDEIGWMGTTAGKVVDELKGLAVDTIDVHINSIGGSAFDGIAIYNALRTHDARIVTQVDSAALSIASVIAQAGDSRIMVSGSQMMIHEAHGLVIGYAEDMRQYADVLDQQSSIIAGIYAERVGDAEQKEHFRELMSSESWFDADETVAAGLADEVYKPPMKKDSTPGVESNEGAAEDRWRDFIAAADTVRL